MRKYSYRYNILGVQINFLPPRKVQNSFIKGTRKILIWIISIIFDELEPFIGQSTAIESAVGGSESAKLKVGLKSRARN